MYTSLAWKSATDSVVAGRFHLSSLVILLVCLLGCGEPNVQQPTYPVSGSVSLDGKPLANATVVLHAVDKTKFKWEEIPQGKTDDQGRFELFTYSSNDGAPAGEYQVAIAVLQAGSDDGSDQVKRERSVSLPAKYAEPKTSGLTATIEKRKTTLPSFQLSSK